MKIRYLALATSAALTISGAAIGEGDRHARGESGARASGDMQQSTNSATVKQAQQALRQMGHDAGPADGQWGPKTQSAVKAFQQSKGIEASGRLDARTLGELNLQASSSTGSGERSDPGSMAAPQSEGSASAGSSAPPEMKQDESRDQQRQQQEGSAQEPTKSY